MTIVPPAFPARPFLNRPTPFCSRSLDDRAILLVPFRLRQRRPGAILRRVVRVRPVNVVVHVPALRQCRS